MSECFNRHERLESMSLGACHALGLSNFQLLLPSIFQFFELSNFQTRNSAGRPTFALAAIEHNYLRTLEL